MTTRTTLATAAGHDRRLAAISEAARRLYDAEIALHIARQGGVVAWIGAAYDPLSEAIADHTRAIAALQAGACPLTAQRNWPRPMEPPGSVQEPEPDEAAAQKPRRPCHSSGGLFDAPIEAARYSGPHES